MCRGRQNLLAADLMFLPGLCFLSSPGGLGCPRLLTLNDSWKVLRTFLSQRRTSAEKGGAGVVERGDKDDGQPVKRSKAPVGHGALHQLENSGNVDSSTPTQRHTSR